jgi:hypothetical protein
MTGVELHLRAGELGSLSGLSTPLEACMTVD